jgi:hypothetical protein
MLLLVVFSVFSVSTGFVVPSVYGFRTDGLSLAALSNKKGRANNKYNEMPRDRLNEMRELEAKYKGLIDDSLGEFTTGDSKRSGRERDLKVQFASEPKVERRIDESTLRKWSPEMVDAVMTCLNMVYSGKEELTDAERVGALDWGEFDAKADAAGIFDFISTEVTDDSTSSSSSSGSEGDLKMSGRARVIRDIEKWVRYHQKKGDIKFAVNLENNEGAGERWTWIPRPQYKRNATRTRQNVRHRKANGLMPDKKKPF